MFFNASDGLPDSPVSNGSGKEEVKVSGSDKGKDEDSGKSDRCSSHSGSKSSPRRKESRTLEMMKRVLRRQRTADSEISVDSQDLDRRSSEGEVDKQNVSKSNDPEVKYRLEFSGMMVDTDVENEPRRRLSEMSFMANNNGSFDEGVCPPIDPKLIAQMSRMDNWSINASSSDRSKASSDHKLLELMQTPSLMSRHISVGKVSEELISLTDLYGSNQSSASPRSSVDQRVAEFLRTPSLSSRASSKWSSYENISTPSVKDDDFDCIGRRFANLNSLLSQTSSSASLCSMADGLCYVELSLQAKVKIADKPVKGFVKTRNCGQPCILSFSGCYGDDEAVLKWRRDPNERLWTNEPILEICPKTKLTKLPSYMRGRLSSASSQTSSLSFRSTSSQPR
ncbi:hypothetical protein FSP39_002281 [Pinctada imbricata]|uniref:Uncharacterized protein n=1 Tax=Pinctada imbricata TaxID=66713 RepID=A0AA88XMS0_PINIB|nr:hypothetical protein FSP39_002281 [Pinctada imbricata]